MNQFSKQAAQTASNATPGTPANVAAGSIHSATLLAGRDSLVILHQNESYVLRKTRAGKLILTK